LRASLWLYSQYQMNLIQSPDKHYVEVKKRVWGGTNPSYPKRYRIIGSDEIQGST
jgi:hypothetical protein